MESDLIPVFGSEEGGEGGPPSASESWYKAVEGTWEEKQAILHPNIYATWRTAADLLPFARFALPSGRAEFAEQSTLGKTVSLGLDTLSLIPAGLISSGVRASLKGLVGGVERMVGGSALKATKKLEVLGDVTPFLPEPFRPSSAVDNLVEKFKVSTEEARVLLGEAPPATLWSKAGRSGAMVNEPSTEFQALFTPKSNKLRKEIAENIKYWTETPPDVQARDYYLKKWVEEAKKIPGIGDHNIEEVFSYQATKFLGDQGRKMKMGEAEADLVANLWKDALSSPRSLLKRVEPGYAYKVPTIFLPSRKVFGAGELFHKSFSGVYEPVVEMFGKANQYQFAKIQRLYQLMEDAGIGKFSVHKTKGAQFAFSISKEVWEEAGGLARVMDTAAATGVDEVGRAELLLQASPQARKIWTNVVRPYFDELYVEHFKNDVMRIFGKRKLSEKGFRQLDLLLNGDGTSNIPGVFQRLDDLFRFQYTDRDISIPGVHAQLTSLLDKVKRAPTYDWFVKGKKPVDLDLLSRDLTWRSKENRKGFMNYVDNYTARMRDEAYSLAERRTAALTGRQPSFEKSRTLIEGQYSTDLSRILEMRTRQQALAFEVYPNLDRIVEKASLFPPGLKNYTEHWLSRMLGEPSSIDESVGRWLTGTVGAIEQKIGQMVGKEMPGVWDGYRTMHLAKRINDLVYLGGLGFRPFSALRNLFQTPLNVPTDLGGVKDIYWLARGYKRASNEATRQYIRDIGAIRKYAPDLYLRPQVASFGPKLFGKQLPTMEGFRDVGMWLFSGTDRLNRYVTGGAVLEKWEHYAQKFLTREKCDPEAFMNKMRFHGRDSWIRKKLVNLFDELPNGVKNSVDGSKADEILSEAKKLFTNDVIADTQWLYGLADAPALTSKGGVVTKTGMVFQSWWMNYASALEKWFLRTETSGMEKAERMFTWMLSSAIAYELMTGGIRKELTGKSDPFHFGFKEKTALKTVGVGPIPSAINEFMIPAPWAPVYHALTIPLSALSLTDSERVTARIKRMMKSSLVFLPGGLFSFQLGQRIADEGLPEGLAKGIINYYSAKDQEK